MAIEVLVHGPLSRTELARRLDLSAGSLTRLTKPLIESGLLVEVARAGTGPAEVRQGRPSQPLDIVAESRSFVGFKITERHGLRRRHHAQERDRRPRRPPAHHP